MPDSPRRALPAAAACAPQLRQRGACVPRPNSEDDPVTPQPFAPLPAVHPTEGRRPRTPDLAAKWVTPIGAAAPGAFPKSQPDRGEPRGGGGPLNRAD
jgi:hypothetical protein